jgi:hypothetical protein
MKEQEQLIPVYRCTGKLEYYISVDEARERAKNNELMLSSKGRGRKYRITAAHLPPDPNYTWKPSDSGGYTVLQMID